MLFLRGCVVCWRLRCSFTLALISPGPERVPETVYLEKIKKIFIFFENFRNIFGWGALPPRPPNFWLGGQSPPRPPLNGRSSHLIEAAKRGRLDQMFFFFGAADDTRAADDRPAGRPAERPLKPLISGTPRSEVHVPVMVTPRFHSNSSSVDSRLI